MPFAATWPDLEIIILSEVIQTNIIYHLYVESKIDTNEIIYETEIDLYIREQIYGCHGKGHSTGKNQFSFQSQRRANAFDYVDHNKLWKILREMGPLDHLTCLLRNE